MPGGMPPQAMEGYYNIASYFSNKSSLHTGNSPKPSPNLRGRGKVPEKMAWDPQQFLTISKNNEKFRKIFEI